MKTKTQPCWWLYLIRQPNQALYCGISTDVERRLAQHQAGKGAKALRGKAPLYLVWRYCVGEDKAMALRLEYKIKRLTKVQKERIILTHQLPFEANATHLNEC